MTLACSVCLMILQLIWRGRNKSSRLTKWVWKLSAGLKQMVRKNGHHKINIYSSRWLPFLIHICNHIQHWLWFCFFVGLWHLKQLSVTPGYLSLYVLNKFFCQIRLLWLLLFAGCLHSAEYFLFRSVILVMKVEEFWCGENCSSCKFGWFFSIHPRMFLSQSI